MRVKAKRVQVREYEVTLSASEADMLKAFLSRYLPEGAKREQWSPASIAAGDLYDKLVKADNQYD